MSIPLTDSQKLLQLKEDPELGFTFSSTPPNVNKSASAKDGSTSDDQAKSPRGESKTKYDGETERNCLRLKNLPKGISKDYLQMFFENPRKGGPVSAIEYNDKEDTAIVTFEKSTGILHLISSTAGLLPPLPHCVYMYIEIYPSSPFSITIAFKL